jgi:hypothetical protein
MMMGVGDSLSFTAITSDKCILSTVLVENKAVKF